MVFITRIASAFKQATRKHAGLELSTSSSSMYQTVRCVSYSRLFIGGLPYEVDSATLSKTFAAFGDVDEARVIINNESGISRGIGFVAYKTSEAALTAIRALDGKEFHGRFLRVKYAADRPRGPRPTGGWNHGGAIGIDFYDGLKNSNCEEDYRGFGRVW